MKKSMSLSMGPEEVSVRRLAVLVVGSSEEAFVDDEGVTVVIPSMTPSTSFLLGAK